MALSAEKASPLLLDCRSSLAGTDRELRGEPHSVTTKATAHAALGRAGGPESAYLGSSLGAQGCLFAKLVFDVVAKYGQS